MSVECTSCGHLIPAGQFRCGQCGALSPRQSLEDFGGLAEVVAEREAPRTPPPAAPSLAEAAPEPPAPDPVSPASSPMSPASSPVEVASSVAPSAPGEPQAAVGPSSQPQAAPSASRATPAGVARPTEPPREAEAADTPAAPAEANGSANKEPTVPVPKGTFASEAPQAPKSPADPTGPRPVAPAREVGEPVPTRGEAQSSTLRVKQLRVAVRPPFLASESLREDMAPVSPGQRMIDRTLLGAGALGVAVNLALAFDNAFALLGAFACALLLGITRLRLSYGARAGVVASISGLTLAAIVALRVTHETGIDDALVAIACGLLPAALLFRSWYRGALAARVGVGASLVLAFGWSALTSNRGLLALEFTWQSWLPALAWYVFGVLCLLSLLAFMGDETTGGCHAWAIGILVWFGLFACLRWALEQGAGAAAGSYQPLGLTEAAMTAPFAVALAQVCAQLFVGRAKATPRPS